MFIFSSIIPALTGYLHVFPAIVLGQNPILCKLHINLMAAVENIQLDRRFWMLFHNPIEQLQAVGYGYDMVTLAMKYLQICLCDVVQIGHGRTGKHFFTATRQNVAAVIIILLFPFG